MRFLTRFRPKRSAAPPVIAGYSGNLKGFWEDCQPMYAHVAPRESGRAASTRTLSLFGSAMTDAEIEAWLPRFLYEYGLPDMKPFRGAHVLEYGFGSGLLGAVLYRAGLIARWTGVDIAERQIAVARETLREYPQSTFLLAPVDFAVIGADVLISHACIQHFPSEPYFLDFMANANHSSARHLFLQIRHGATRQFTTDVPSEACRTNPGDMAGLLTNYELAHASEVGHNFYQYTRWGLV